ncbi:MAG: TonB family protein, partial [Candidatus Riflebacteria bacterium]|nr:TonB family protein [Candidatus Riflebacteria bacterium]
HEKKVRQETEVAQPESRKPPVPETETDARPEVVEHKARPAESEPEPELKPEHKPAVKPVLKQEKQERRQAASAPDLQKPRKKVREPAKKPRVPVFQMQTVTPTAAPDNSESSHSDQMTAEGPSVAKNTLNSPINDRAEPVVRVDALTEAQQSEISRYLARIRAILEKNKKYPRAARRKRIEGQVPVSFAVLADGSLHDPKIAGQVPEELREATLQLLMNLRLPAPPLSWQTRSRIECTISYRLH